ncbi:MAG: hypothetical protein WBO10_12120 [Pyrinomonadaceae bacterium]
MKEIFAVVAAILAVIGNVPYLVDIFRGRVQPHAYTWFVWTLVTGIVFFGQLAKGAGVGALPTAASGVFTLSIFILSLKHGFKHIAAIDTVFLALALLGLIPWILTNDPTISVVIAVSIDLIAFMPTLRKTWIEPTTETPLLYSMNVLRHVLALFSMQAYNVATVLHSVAMVATNTAMTILIVTPRPKKGPHQ